jgi:hypothetical protein
MTVGSSDIHRGDAGLRLVALLLQEERFATPDGEVVRPVIHHPGAVAVIAQPSRDALVMVRQYRYPVRRWTLEIPAGTRVPGEAPERTAASRAAGGGRLCGAHLHRADALLPRARSVG